MKDQTVSLDEAVERVMEALDGIEFVQLHQVVFVTKREISDLLDGAENLSHEVMDGIVEFVGYFRGQFLEKAQALHLISGRLPNGTE
jgi:hypothetical protein